jgi:hypothetical protein
MLKVNDCPCYQCICIPICKNKLWDKLFDCRIISNYYYNEGWGESQADFENRFLNIKVCLNLN